MEKIPNSMAQIPEHYVVLGSEGYPESPEISAVELLLGEFESHEMQEGQFLLRYKEIAEKVKNPIIRFLLRLIISDEERHHAITHAMVATLKGDLHWTKPEDALRGVHELGQEKEGLLSVTEQFIQLEREGVKEYKKLIKASKGYYRDLFVLLFQTMIHDSEKHIQVLEFLRERLKEA